MYRIIRNPVFITAAALLMLLTACGKRRGGDNRSVAVDTARVAELQEERLLYEHHFARTPGLRARPHHTVVATLESDTDHEGNTGGVGWDTIPYEMPSAGWYSFCMEDDEGEAHYTVLKDVSGNQVARWDHGAASCDPVHVAAGNYDLEIHHGKKSQPDDKHDLVFLAPQEVKHAGSNSAAAAGLALFSAKLRSASVADVLDIQVPRAASVSDLITDQPGEGWVIRSAADAVADSITNTDKILLVSNTYTAYFTAPVASAFNPGQIVLYPRTVTRALDKTVHFSIGTSSPSAYQDAWLARSWLYDGDDRTSLYSFRLGKRSTPLDFEVKIKETNHFRLSEQGFSRIVLNVSQLILQNDSDHDLSYLDTYYETMYGKHSVEFYPSNRIGAVQGQSFPKLFNGEAAVFDQCYDPNSGFPEGTRYMTITKGEDLDVIWSQVYPDAKAHTVVATKEARIILYPHPSYQGDALVVQRTLDLASDALATCSDSSVLNDGTAQSIVLQPYENNISNSEYEHRIFVKSGKCVGCNLRGFTIDATVKNLSGSDFSESDLTGADLSGADLSSCKLTDANLSWAKLDNADITGAELTGARLENIDLTTTKGLLSASMQVDSDNKPLRTTSLAHSIVDGSLPSPASLQDKWRFFDMQDAAIQNFTLQDVDLRTSSMVLGGARAAGAKLTNVQINANASSADFSKAVFSNVTWSGTGTGFKAPGAHMTDVNFAGSGLSEADLSNAVFAGSVHLEDADLSTATLSGATFPNGAHLENVTLSGADLSNAKLPGAYLCGATISKAILFGTDMAGAYLEHEAANAKCTKGTAAILSGSNMQNAKLNGAHMQGVVMDNVTWYGTDATGSGAIMTSAHLSHADLPGLNLQDAHLGKAIMTDTVLVNANLAGAVLSGADLSYANLKGATLTGADLNGTAENTTLLSYAATSTEAGKATLELLEYKRTDQYMFYLQDYGATALPTLMTSFIICPDNTSGSCSGHFTVTATPNEPTSCTIVAATQYQIDAGLADDQGNVLQCTSNRHHK